MLHLIRHIKEKLTISRGKGGRNPIKTLVNPQQWKQWVAQLVQMSDKLKNLPLTNYNLGLMHFEKGNLSDAIFRFSLVNFLDPSHAQSHYHLARCLMIKQDDQKAQKELEAALALKPDYIEAQYALDILTTPDTVAEVPQEIVAEKYRQMAKTYRSLEEEGEETYRTVVRELLKSIDDKNPNLEVLELGCGSGLCGKILKEKEVAKHITGVENSTYLQERAQLRAVNDQPAYETVLSQDSRQYLQSNDATFDVIFVSGLLYAYRDLATPLELLVQHLKTQGYLVFIKHTVPESVEGDVYFDRQADHFYHHKRVLTEPLGAMGVELKEAQAIELHDGKGGELLIFRRQ